MCYTPVLCVVCCVKRDVICDLLPVTCKMQNSKIRFLYVTVFVGGMTSLAVEFSASRLLEPYFGTSNLVWASIIGLILLYLTVGYALGGRWADRSPKSETLFGIIAWAAFAVGLVPFVARPVLLLASRGLADFNAGMLAGSFGAVLVLFSVPVTLLGCVSPFAIRLAVSDVATSGGVAGRIYAISTGGSFLGTFLPVLVTIPNIGTRNTFLLFAFVLLAMALVGLGRRAWRYLWMPVVLVALAVLLSGQVVKPVEGAIYESESAYNYIQVVEQAGVRYLLLNEGQGVHSIYDPNNLRTFGTWDYFLIAPYFNPPPFGPERVKRVAVIGLAAGTIARQYTAVYGPLPIDGIEIDPKIVQAGHDYFAMDEPNLNVIIGDGRYALAHSAQHYDVIGIDAYRLPYIPWHLTTREFFAQVRAHLTSDGVVVVNVGHTEDDFRMVEAMVTTLRTVFPSVHVVNLPGTFNAILVATVQPSIPDNLRANLPLLKHPFLRDVAADALKNLRPTTPSRIVFSDDQAPVEQLTNAIVLRFLTQSVGGQVVLP
jgi:spermidine synthase